MFERKKKRKKEKTSYNETEDREMEIVDGIRNIEISSKQIKYDIYMNNYRDRFFFWIEWNICSLVIIEIKK